ncbi:hypothetical protein E4U13_006727 [Claviceps humidiphila]|uniref:Uncharacterized protein n=1 Tax=Claviceps humidiphila TaxID=1294629 RepID=A0A9P7PTW6_9HYPO|nr:hypothetical protein E4U13_006727 [Claviceps humidiphila]
MKEIVSGLVVLGSYLSDRHTAPNGVDAGVNGIKNIISSRDTFDFANVLGYGFVVKGIPLCDPVLKVVLARLASSICWNLVILLEDSGSNVGCVKREFIAQIYDKDTD